MASRKKILSILGTIAAVIAAVVTALTVKGDSATNRIDRVHSNSVD